MGPESRHDVVVVGGRVAGALTAARLARAGASVLVLEARTFPAPTLSTHFFRGDGLVRSLAELGVLDAVLDTGAPRLVCEYDYVGGAGSCSIEPPQEPGDAGFCLSVRRQVLDTLVARRVASLPGVEMRTGTRVSDLLREEDGSVVGVLDESGTRHLAPLVVGADGRRSGVARRVQAGVLERHPAARVMSYRYVSGWSGPQGGPCDGPEFSLLGNELAYVFPSDGGVACVAVTVPLVEHLQARGDATAEFDRRLERHRGLWPRLAAARPVGRLFVGPPEDSVVRAAAGPGWALVGDAGTHQDPWTGFGMDTAARQAEALADAVADDPQGWAESFARSRDRVTLDRFRETAAAAPDLGVLVG